MFNTKQVEALNKAVKELAEKVNSIGRDTDSDYEDIKFGFEEDEDKNDKGLYYKYLWADNNFRFTGHCLDKRIEQLQTDINHTNRVLKALMNYLNLDSEFVEKAEWEVKPKKAKELAKKGRK